MHFVNLTRHVEIGANCYALEVGGKKIVLDSGLHPARDGFDALPDFSLLEDDSVDAIFLSHSHQDHLGSLPVLMRHQPRARLFTTEATRQISDIMLHNSVNVMLHLRDDYDIAEYPLFTHREVDVAARRWQSVPLRQRWGFDGERLSPDEEAELSFEFFDAGHILGSVGTLIRAEGRTLFYTGDVNFEAQTLSNAAAFPEEPLDVVIIETTRGDTPTPPGMTRRSEEDRLGVALKKAFEDGGTILIPVFALGKTQELLGILARLKKNGTLPGHFPLYIGGLSAKLTELYDQFASYWPRQNPELKLMDHFSPFIVSGRNADDLPLKSHRIYALTSGMMTQHTLSNVFASKLLSHPEHHLFFIGYADPDSPGGKIKAASTGDAVQLNEHDHPCPLQCHVEDFNLSAHATRDHIRAWVNKVAPKKVVLVHGDPAAVEWFRATLQADLPESEIIVPTPGVRIEL